jgi:hypothetical protein
VPAPTVDRAKDARSVCGIEHVAGLAAVPALVADALKPATQRIETDSTGAQPVIASTAAIDA